MKNTIINRMAVRKVALALGDINKQVVFVGGAVVSIYIDDPSAEDVRPTKDVDISVEIKSLGELEKLRLKLIERGFKHNSEDNVICRFRLDEILVDVMGTKQIGWAPANKWFEEGFPLKQSADMYGTPIYILPLPFYLASKFTAFSDRKGNDPRTSHDFEDIVYLLNYTSNIKEIVMNSPTVLREYLKNVFLDILKSETLQEAILCNLFYENQMNRYERIMRTLKDIANEI